MSRRSRADDSAAGRGPVPRPRAGVTVGSTVLLAGGLLIATGGAALAINLSLLGQPPDSSGRMSSVPDLRPTSTATAATAIPVAGAAIASVERPTAAAITAGARPEVATTVALLGAASFGATLDTAPPSTVPDGLPIVAPSINPVTTRPTAPTVSTKTAGPSHKPRSPRHNHSAPATAPNPDD
jgi:hypothetical protein